MTAAADRDGLLSAVLAGDEAARRALLDWAGEAGEPVPPMFAPAWPPTLAALDGYDWREAFGFAGGEEGVGNHGTPEPTHPGAAPVPLTPFGVRDVAFVHATKDGENDEADWLACGVLWDGRAFGLKAGCDYTGWD